MKTDELTEARIRKAVREGRMVDDRDDVDAELILLFQSLSGLSDDKEAVDVDVEDL